MRRLPVILFLVILTGCTTTAKIQNTPIDVVKPVQTGREKSDDALFFISVSGGGTRAAALSYGVLEGLRDTTFVIDGEDRRLLDEIVYIRSVSGGSVTAG